MKLLFSIILNSIIFYLIVILLWENKELWIQSWVTLWCVDCDVSSIIAWKTYITAWIILWILNTFVKPILKILSFPLFILSFWLISILVNAVILGLLTYVLNDVLQISWVGYTINWWVNFIIAVAIFTILNMFYSLLLFKK